MTSFWWTTTSGNWPRCEMDKSPIHEKFLPELLSRHRGNRLTFSDDLQEAVRQSAAIFVAVGTPPTEERRSRLVLRRIRRARNLRRHFGTDTRSSSKKGPSRSTPASGCANSFCAAEPMRNRSMLRRIQNSCARAQPSRTSCFPIASSSAATPNALANILRQVYAPLTDGSYYERADAIPGPDRASIPAPIIVTSTKSAELIKHASNAFLAMKISFINAVASVCESVGGKCIAPTPDW